MKRLVFEAEHEQLRDKARQFLEKECAPNVEKWESDSSTANPMWQQASTA